MTEARPRLYVRPLILLALVAMLAGLIPAPAQAQSQSTTWNAAAACPASLPASGFSDATGPHGHNIDCLAWFALTTGRTATSYDTIGDVRRDQTSSFLVRVLDRLVPSGLDMPSRDVGAFPDVSSGPHRANVEALAGFDPPVVAGFPDGSYQPRRSLTRGQFASIIARSLDHLADQDLIDRLPAASSPFPDTRGSVHEGNIARLARAGIVQGKDADTYDPNGSITRGQTASILARMLGGLVNEDLLLQPRRFSGVVHDATGTGPGEVGDPIAGARITAIGMTEVAATSNGQGRYGLWLQQPGPYTLTVTASGFVSQQRGLVLPDADAETDLGMYEQAVAPADSTSAGAPSDITIAGDGDFWQVDLPFDARTASDIRLKFPENLVISLGESPTAALFFSRNREDGTSDRVGADSGVHTVYYNLGTSDAPDWRHVEATFDANGTLVEVNGTAYADDDATS